MRQCRCGTKLRAQPRLSRASSRKCSAGGHLGHCAVIAAEQVALVAEAGAVQQRQRGQQAGAGFAAQRLDGGGVLSLVRGAAGGL